MLWVTCVSIPHPSYVLDVISVSGTLPCAAWSCLFATTSPFSPRENEIIS